MGDPILAKRVREVRDGLSRERGERVTQSDFAELLGLETGQAVSNLERGVAEVKVERAVRLAELSGKPVAYFLDATFTLDAPATSAQPDPDQPQGEGVGQQLETLRQEQARQSEMLERLLSLLETRKARPRSGEG